MALTIDQWRLHVSRLENDLAELEASPELPAATNRVAELKTKLPTLSGPFHTQAEYNSAFRRRCDLDNQLQKARHDLKIKSGEDLKRQLLQARYSLAKAERLVGSRIMFVV